SAPMPIPAQECNVTPSIFIAAIPVDAVIPSAGQLRPPSSLIISRRRTDLPVPAEPEKKVLRPSLTRWRTALCSGE
ncbi:hypothetical protein B0H10DRAFT_1670116, partial [Mycena sp. CBHHK59/15]